MGVQKKKIECSRSDFHVEPTRVKDNLVGRQTKMCTQFTGESWRVLKSHFLEDFCFQNPLSQIWQILLNFHSSSSFPYSAAVFLILTFKAIHGLAPEYISNLISVKDVSKYSLRSNGGLLNQPGVRRRKTLGDRSFTAAAPTLWNKLPAHLRNMDNFINFKSSLKTHLFRTAF